MEDHVNQKFGSSQSNCAMFNHLCNWYNKVFGFNLVEQGVANGKPWAIIKCSEAMLCMYENNDLQSGQHEPSTLNHFGLRITNRDLWEKIIEREGVHVL